jgi:formylglycine-generating enzyme required for sulfatase activity
MTGHFYSRTDFNSKHAPKNRFIIFSFGLFLSAHLIVSCVRFGFSTADGGTPGDFSITDHRATDSSYEHGLRDLVGTPNPDRCDGPPWLDIPVLDGPKNIEEFLVDGQRSDTQSIVPITWVTIQPGTFLMGSPASEICRNDNETQHQVTLTHAFEISATEITLEQINQIVEEKRDDLLSCGPKCPVVALTAWDRITGQYCNALSILNGLTPCYECAEVDVSFSCNILGKYVACQEAAAFKGSNIYQCPGYRLPTEAEWEYAYRAGQTTPLYNGDITECITQDPNAEMIAWYEKNGKNTIHPVSQKNANAWNLFDMAGNVAEWVNDQYQADLGTSAVVDPAGPEETEPLAPCDRPARVIRGGSYISTPGELRAASRSFSTGSSSSVAQGFRVVRTLF